MWVAAAIGGYFLFAAVAIGDRLLLTKTVKDPLAYIFFIGLAALSGLVLIPIIPAWPATYEFILSALAGALFLFGLWPLMAALRESDASRVFPASGGLVTILTFLLATIFLKEALTNITLIAFALLFIGYLLLTIRGKLGTILTDILDWRIILSSVLISVSLVMRRFVFSTEPFLGAWVAVAVGMGIAALSLLILPHTFERISVSMREGKNHHLGLIFVNQAGGAVAAFLQSFAISQGPVALVQALSGIQYVFILAFALLLTRWVPTLLSENFADGALLRKVSGTLVVSVGVGLIVFA